MGDLVPLLLGEQDLASEAAVVGPLLEHLLEHAGSAKRVLARLVEEVEEDPVARNEAGAARAEATNGKDIGDPLGRPPSHRSGRARVAVPGLAPWPARSRSGIPLIRAGSRPSRVLVPARTVTGRSVLSRSVKHGMPRYVVSSWIPPGVGEDGPRVGLERKEVEIADRVGQGDPGVVAPSSILRVRGWTGKRTGSSCPTAESRSIVGPSSGPSTSAGLCSVTSR